jgi:hypothetical protein
MNEYLYEGMDEQEILNLVMEQSRLEHQQQAALRQQQNANSSPQASSQPSSQRVAQQQV